MQRNLAHLFGVQLPAPRIERCDVQQRDVVEKQVIRRFLIPARMHDRPVDTKFNTGILGHILGTEPHVIAKFQHVFVHAMRRGQHPSRFDQRPATPVLQFPQRFADARLVGPAVGGERPEYFRLPGRARITHRNTAVRAATARPGLRRRLSSITATAL